MNDEYDYIYKQYEGSGFEFSYSKGHLGESSSIFRDEIKKLSPSTRNKDLMFVKCNTCGIHMEFEVGKNGVLSGKWICPTCGATVREKTAYTTQLDRENAELQRILDSADDDDNDFADEGDDDDIPDCCDACGGPWPDCKDSCKIFED